MSDLTNVISYVVAGVSFIFALFSVVGAFRSGVLRRLRLGSLEIEATPKEREQVKALISAVNVAQGRNVPFETEQLALYYGQVLAQSKVAFWFSLVFASLGFVVIVVAVFLYSTEATGRTVAQFAAGLVMDAVASLFFVQSRNAQRSMAEFFDKLRRDREQLESRTLCEQVEHNLARDALRIQLSLYYAGVDNNTEVAKTLMQGTLIPRN